MHNPHAADSQLQVISTVKGHPALLQTYIRQWLARINQAVIMLQLWIRSQLWVHKC
jgi:hypothetical protein